MTSQKLKAQTMDELASLPFEPFDGIYRRDSLSSSVISFMSRKRWIILGSYTFSFTPAGVKVYREARHCMQGHRAHGGSNGIRWGGI